PEYQNNKASAYNNLAYLQAQCKNFESAISNYEKAITIRRRLANDNPFFLPTFLKSEFGLIVSLCNSDKFEQAQSILQEIKPLAEKYLAANPNDIIVQELNQKFAELLIICSIS
ncbi:MAG: tetratricopeptide repeat-containing protein, partial [Bacteroidales bacterium]|nr:tetratricopeptide repeat-containing protein [Bacteroidales bacterium]